METSISHIQETVKGCEEAMREDRDLVIPTATIMVDTLDDDSSGIRLKGLKIYVVQIMEPFVYFPSLKASKQARRARQIS